MKKLKFRVDAADGRARATTIETRRGTIHTPIFMPVGTVGTVKTLSPEELRTLGAEIILGNTYHLYLRPGTPILKKFGGLHSFMAWDGPILTDSGGYQFFSISELCKFSDLGVKFRSHIDGSHHEFTPESCIGVQRAIGSDIMMVLDQCPALPATDETLREAVRRSTSWALRCLKSTRDTDGALFAIAQGGTDLALRAAHIEELGAHAFDGLALGGLAVGEAPEEMYATLESVVPQMPTDRPRYLMGVGKPIDILTAIEQGVDMFDCVMPTRNARNAQVFTRGGALNLRNARFATDGGPIDDRCVCAACQNHSRAYLHHLLRQKEVYGIRLTTLHNLTYYLDLVRAARAAILEKRFQAFARTTRAAWAENR